MAHTYLSGGRTLTGVVLPSSDHSLDSEETLTTTAGRIVSLLDADVTTSHPRRSGDTAALGRPWTGSRASNAWKCDTDEGDGALTLRRRDMGDAVLAQTIQPWISSHYRLVELDVSRNRLTGLPQGLVHLASLRTLNVSGNLLRSIPLVLYHMHGLIALDLSDNQLQSVSPRFPSALTHLQVLHLDGNAIESLPLTLATAWTRMTHLRLGTDVGPGSGNRLRALPDLESMTALVELQVAHNLLEWLPPMPSGLRHLQASHNRLRVLDERVYDRCRHTLETLQLADNLLVTLPHGLVHLDHLEMLNVARNRLQRFPADLLEKSQASPARLNIIFTGNPVIVPSSSSIAADGSPPNRTRSPSLVHSLRELAFRRALRLVGDRAKMQLLPEYLAHQLARGEVGICTMCKGPFLDEYKTSVQVKRYRGHPAVAREVRYCSTACSRMHAIRIEQLMHHRQQQQQQQQQSIRLPLAIPLATATRGWSLEWIVAAASAAADQAANDEDVGYLTPLPQFN